GLARALPMVPGIGQAVGETVRKSYARWDRRLPDGRVPVYTGQGQLKGYFSDTQLLGQAFGLGNVSGAQESGLSKYLLGQRDTVREMKREYMEALSQNDPAHAMRLKQQYEHMYPGMGGLPVKKSDIRALHMRQDVTRLERILETMPSELRGEFQAVIATTFGLNYPGILGMQQPGLEAGSTIRLRSPYRHRRRGGTTGRVSQGLHGVHLREKLKREGIDISDDANRRGIYYGRGPYY
ncbi:hypothetical protein LCGC14_1599440, partial [marine sediment metagenome]